MNWILNKGPSSHEQVTDIFQRSLWCIFIKVSFLYAANMLLEHRKYEKMDIDKVFHYELKMTYESKFV